MQVANGSTDVSTYFVLRDSTTHAPKTDVTVTDIDMYYVEQGAAISAKADATALAAADSAHGDNQAFHVGQGLYRIDWPDTCFNGGVGKLCELIVVCTGVDTTFLEVELTGVAQTGDSYAIVNHADYGNAKLVRSTTPANTLTVDASHRALSDLASILGTALTETAGYLAAGFKKFFNIETPVATVASVDQTGDSYARLGSPAGASVSADIAAVKAQTAAIEADTQDLQTQVGTDGAGLTAVPWNAAWDAEVATAVRTELATELAEISDTNDVVNHADYGNAKLVRSTTPANTLTVDASHQALALTNAVTNDAITAAAIANGAIDAATFAAGAIDAAAIATGAIDADALAADTITAAKLHADVTTELQAGLATATAALILATPANKLLTDAGGRVEVSGTKNTLDDLNDAAAAPTASDVADAVWDEALAGHLGVGSTGAALSAAGSAGDPWLTALPGAYGAGTAGDIIGNLVTDIGALTPAVAISATTAASVATGALAVRTHHSLSQAISSTYAGNLNAATKLWLAVKAEKDDTDAQAVIFIEKTAGLTVLAGAAYTTVAHGSLTVGGLAGAWTVTVALDEVATGLLTAYADGMLWAECKALVAGSTVAVWDGVCDVARGIVQTVV